MPLLALNEDDEDQETQSSSDDKQEEDDEHDHRHRHEEKHGLAKLQETRRLKSFKSRSCFCLADLQHEQTQS